MPFVHKLATVSLGVILLSGASSVARAEDAPTFADRPDEDAGDNDRTFGFLLNPLAIAVGIFGGEADVVFGRFAAVALEGAVYRRGTTMGEALGAGLLLYPFGRALHGLYVESRVVYARPWSETILNVDWGADAIGLGATAGWQWTWDYGFSVRAGAGAMYFVGAPRPAQTDALLTLGPQVVLDGSIGWAF